MRAFQRAGVDLRLRSLTLPCLRQAERMNNIANRWEVALELTALQLLFGCPPASRDPREAG